MPSREPVAKAKLLARVRREVGGSERRSRVAEAAAGHGAAALALALALGGRGVAVILPPMFLLLKSIMSSRRFLERTLDIQMGA